MQKVLILRGLPGSGKSTWSQSLQEEHKDQYKRVNLDALRDMLDNGHWTPANEKFAKSLQDDIILRALKEGKNVIIDNTHLDPKPIAHLRELVKGRAAVEIVDFTDIDVGTALERNANREKKVPESVIKEMYTKYLAERSEPIPYDPNLPDCIICDVDGTLAINDSGRSPFDWKRVGEDSINLNLDRLLELFSSAGLYTMLFSGRDSICRQETEDWLDLHSVQYDSLFMRSQKDSRKDYVVKEEMYREHIEGKYNVLAWIDDRAQVVRHIYHLGLPIYRVGDPDLDF